MKRWVGVVVVLLALGGGLWVTVKAITPEKGVYRTNAVIQEIWAKDLVLVKHEPIPGLMDESMSMAFFVQSPKMLEGVKSGDRFRITLKETPGKLLIVKMERAPSP